MNCKGRFGALTRVSLSGVTAASFLVVQVGSLGGCADHRISLAEFVAMQRPGSAVAEEPAAAIDLSRYLGPYLVGPGDVLNIDLLGADGAPVFPQFQARIDRNGQVDLPVVGIAEVSDLELGDVEDRILQAYIPAVVQKGVCHVELTSIQTTNVLVVGAVISPGLMPLRRTERNMLFAIVGAQGVSQIASGLATLRRVRRPGEEVTLNLRDPVQLRAALSLPPLEDGDIIEVHAATPNTLYVGGLVNNPHPQSYDPGTQLTLLQALAAAGGLRSDVIPRVGTLIRRMPDGTDAHVKLNLNRLAMGTDPNIMLQAGDILWVPETLETRVQDFFNRNVFLRAGVSVNYNVTGVEYLNRQGLQSARSGGQNLQDTFDPLGFLTQNTLLQNIQTGGGG